MFQGFWHLLLLLEPSWFLQKIKILSKNILI
jgi:hypothetical protein